MPSSWLDGSAVSPYQARFRACEHRAPPRPPSPRELPVSSAVSNRRAIVAMLTAMALFTGNDTLTKLATADLPPGQIMGIRGVFAVLLTLGLLIAMGEARHLRELRSPILAGRAVLEAS